MEAVAFFAGAIGALGGAIAVIALRNPFYSVLALVVHLFSLAGLFLLLYAEFLAAAQIVVYAGAVMVLYVFVAAYVGNVDEPLWEPIPGQRVLAPLLGLALFVELSIALLGTALKTLDTEGPTIQAGFGSPESIGELLLEDFLIAFEAASLLLLLAAVGAVVLAGKRRDDTPPSDPSLPGKEGDRDPTPNVGTRVSAGGGAEGGIDNRTTPTQAQASSEGPTPTQAHKSSEGEVSGPSGARGGAGEGPQDNQVAGDPTISDGSGGSDRRTSSGPFPAPPQGEAT